MRRSMGRVVFGLLLVLVGVVSLLERFGYDIRVDWSGWWTAFIIVPSLVSMLDEGIRPGNVIGALIGFVMLTRIRNWIPSYLLPLLGWPVILIVAGLALLFGRGKRSYRYHAQWEYRSDDGDFEMRDFDRGDDTDYPDYFVLFGGSDIRNMSRDLKGASVTSLFGGIDADFSHAVIQRDITIHVTSIFGAAEIYLPKNVRVRVKGLPVFGGMSNRHEDSFQADAPVVTIRCFSLFGGSEIY